VSLIVAIQSAQPIKMHPNPSIASPGPELSSVITVVVMVSSPQMPVGPHLMPARPIPSLQDAQAVQVSVNATPLAPEPPRSLVVVVAPVQMPIGAHSAPMTLVVSVQGAETVCALQFFGTFPRPTCADHEGDGCSSYDGRDASNCERCANEPHPNGGRHAGGTGAVRLFL